LDVVRQAGAPLATTTATAVRRALDTLGARRIVLLTPYSQHTTDEEAGFLREAGFEVPLARGFGLKGSDEYCATPPQFWRDRALEAARPDADAYFLSCANISVFSIIDGVEQRLGRPVVTSNQVVIWHALALLGVGDRRNCPGRLFDSLSTEKSAHRIHACVK
jgi:maleate isomerase